MSAFWQQGMGNGLWADTFFTTFTTVRTAILTPVIMIMVFTLLRLAGQKSLTEQTLFNRYMLDGPFNGQVPIIGTCDTFLPIPAVALCYGFLMAAELKQLSSTCSWARQPVTG